MVQRYDACLWLIHHPPTDNLTHRQCCYHHKSATFCGGFLSGEDDKWIMVKYRWLNISELPIYLQYYCHVKSSWKMCAYSGKSKGGGRQGRPLQLSSFLHFHAVFKKTGPKTMMALLPRWLAPPPLGNPGSATDV